MNTKTDELVEGCQRYLKELNKRSLEKEKREEDLRKAEEHKRSRREYWREKLYGDKQQGISVIIPDDSNLIKK